MKLYALAAILCLLSVPARASGAEQIGQYGSWTAYSFMENGARVCYMMASPVKTDGDYLRRGNVYAMITHRPKEKEIGVFSYLSGYDYKKDAPVTVTIDGQSSVLLGADRIAWAADEATDRKLAEALRRGKTMVVAGTSAENIDTMDTFSLSGSDPAYVAISKTCQINK
jgi:hypothetical protein